ncbi:ATP-dependent DNA helicase RecG [Eubacterium ruminantium]|uniref:ATP-dependent DNA helicase RecG n=1 Tax=Eubacterium ruminantium TaxID=42322 RepID=A0A1T4LPF3_9FIRM|nr:RNA-binding domain-containing protein [Eubacterium ruminantium]SCW40716.1 ATP-dependent DNA helicase RecG [Eubacterium ruminantium]SDM38541.1 ATP-dependent DNA helicase RecG [Eubacterium ruminantium]SJZ56517.1 ATP-dependent DNA helicase RecG [Eubacterium ruminantium]
MRIIPYKEDLVTEFKSDLKRYPDSDLIDEIVGMANTKGGNLYLGVEDNGQITGVSKIHKDAIGVTALVANNTVPSVSVRAEIITEEEKDILKIEIPISRTVVSTRSGKMLKRRLKADGTPEVIPMFSYEIVTRLSELALLDFSAGPLAGASTNDFDPNQRIRLRNIIQTKPGGEKNLLTLTDDELDKALRFTTEVDGKVYPTVTGMLILGKENRIVELMPTVKASFQVLEGTKVRINTETSAPLLEVFEKFETYAEAWNPEREVEYGLFRVAVPEFDKAAFREGLINAFCHRDYTMLGAVRVLIDDEGMTISSPGGFIDGVTLENLLTVEPHGKNPALADALKRIGLAEKTGRGIDRIYEGSIIYGRPWPDYSETTSTNVRLFIQRAKADDTFTKFIADEQNRLGKPLSIYALMILSLLKNEKRLTIERIAEMTHLAEGKLLGAIENLIEDGLVEGAGSGKSRSYILSVKVYKENNRSIQYVRQTGIDRVAYPEMIIKLARAQDGFITKQDVAELLKITPDQAYSEIKKLVSEGKIYKYCGGKYTKYKLR